MKLDGANALVTGGAKRVGRAIATELAQAGCHVVIHYHHSKPEALALADQLREGGRRTAIVGGDLGEPDDWARIVENAVGQLGGLDILINNAASFATDRDDTIEAFDAAGWERMLRVNLIAPVALAHHARTWLAQSGHGHVVNLTDISAERPWPNHLSYCVSKAGLSAATKGLARALAPRIRVNAVAPGIAIFPTAYDADERRRLTDKVPLARAGTPDEVARLVRFLVESGDYLTGQIIFMDGGRSIA